MMGNGDGVCVCVCVCMWPGGASVAEVRAGREGASSSGGLRNNQKCTPSFEEMATTLVLEYKKSAVGALLLLLVFEYTMFFLESTKIYLVLIYSHTITSVPAAPLLSVLSSLLLTLALGEPVPLALVPASVNDCFEFLVRPVWVVVH